MPRNKLCWLCNRKFAGNHFVEIEIDGHLREMHKECAKSPEFWFRMKQPFEPLPKRNNYEL